ncbi:hypothetical protein [Bradyrhizobium sp. Tv2a-2]|uniref:hypothetical protein n=1 Tax=Bradyrhizobium sp. Tv2a-2 TaxID=113395 RepID=UPI0004193279|nr:hypothetical protein [Bradyrhizobium sp. Tv2a-2]
MTLLLNDRHHSFGAKVDARRGRLIRKRLAGICFRVLTFLFLCGALAGVIALKTAIYVSRLPLGTG